MNSPTFRNSLIFAAMALLSLWAAVGVFSQQPAPLPIPQCQQYLPYGTPIFASATPTAEICRKGYVTLNDEVAKVPVWTAWTLTHDKALGCIARVDAFATDQSLPNGRQALPGDYDKAGYDQGHIASYDDMAYDPVTASQSFLMSNMAPQLPKLNRVTWLALEKDARAWAVVKSSDTFLIYAGPIYNVATDKKIGKHQVDVPTAFYKIVIDETTAEETDFLFPQSEDRNNKPDKVRTTEAEIERQTGIKFPLPPGVKEVPMWPVDLTAYARVKKAKCGGAQ